MKRKTNLLNTESLAELATDQQAPCISLYQPTHRRRPGNAHDPIRYRNLVKELEASLLQTYSTLKTRKLLEPFEALGHDDVFWSNTLKGLAVLAGPNLFRVFQLQSPVAELAVLADSFHTKPLRRFLQSVDHYQVLGLSLKKIQLFEGNRNVLDETDLASAVPQTIREALGDELTEPFPSVTSNGGVGRASSAMRHAPRQKKSADGNRFRAVLSRRKPRGARAPFTALRPAADPGGVARTSRSFPPGQPQRLSNGGGAHD